MSHPRSAGLGPCQASADRRAPGAGASAAASAPTSGAWAKSALRRKLARRPAARSLLDVDQHGAVAWNRYLDA